MELPSRQEMFNRAWNGLKSQGFVRAISDGAGCTYLAPDGKRCAWGWVDPEGTLTPDGYPRSGGVRRLAGRDEDPASGLASILSDEDLAWAVRLQGVHDYNYSPEDMEEGLRAFAAKYQLTVPE